MIYTVKVTKTQTVVYTIEAEDIDRAIALAKEGRGDCASLPTVISEITAKEAP